MFAIIFDFPFDHPHACGDKATVIVAVPDFVGSSPRVWGQAFFLVEPSALLRIIPTRVVTSRRVISLLLSRRDHPHACGDKRHHVFLSASKTGSSPRVWGQVFFYAQQTAALRIIPTRVGTSETNCPMSDRQRGSSPRVWGQVSHPGGERQQQGIIPTRVGTSIRFLRLTVNQWDHPHACGDKRVICLYHVEIVRIIPTRVGTRL